MSTPADLSYPEDPDAPEAPPRSRIVVALDSSNQSLAALKAAAELAALMQAELQGMFVEDIYLIRLSGLPFTYEIGSYSATRRRLDSGAVERDFRLMAQQMRRAVAQTAVTARVTWSFHVTRGSVTNELLAAAEAAEILTLGRVGRTPGRRLGSTAKIIMRRAMRPVFLLSDEGLTYPLIVLHIGTPASDRALTLAATLVHGRTDGLELAVVADPAHDGDERDLRAQRLGDELDGDEVSHELFLVDDEAQLALFLAEHARGTLVLPGDLADLLETLSRSAILVP